MIPIEQTAEELFNKIRNRFSNLDIGDENGNSSTNDPKKARFFNFDFIKDGENFGNITISIADNKSVKVYYDTNIDSKLSPEQKKIWFNWLKDMREFAKSNVKLYDVRDIAKSGLNLNDLKFLKRDTDSVTKDEVAVSESKLYGTRRSSYQQLENVRIIARHSKPIVDENIPGVRSRNIESFYIENSIGERFRLPEGTTLNGARAYARHVKNGGQLHDDFGVHLGQMIKEMTDLRSFVRNMRGRTFEDIETQQMVESAIDHYGKLHSNLLMLRNQRGYEQYKSLWQPEVLEETDFDMKKMNKV